MFLIASSNNFTNEEPMFTYKTRMILTRNGWKQFALNRAKKKLKGTTRNARLVGRSVELHWHPLSKLRFLDGTSVKTRKFGRFV